MRQMSEFAMEREKRQQKNRFATDDMNKADFDVAAGAVVSRVLS